MKLIIDIPEEDWAFIKETDGCRWSWAIIDGVINGTPLKEKTGHWIKYGRLRCGEQHYQCTSCGYYINFGQWGELYTKEFKYCPNCCAKMKGENKE